MKILFDQNLSHRLVGMLTAQFPGSIHVRDLGMAGAEDAAVWRYAAQNGYAIASKDVDFQQRALLLGFPPKVIWLRVGNCPTSQILTLLASNYRTLLEFDSDPNASFIALG